MQDISTGLELLQAIQRLMFNVQELPSASSTSIQRGKKNFTVADYFEQYNNLLKSWKLVVPTWEMMTE